MSRQWKLYSFYALLCLVLGCDRTSGLTDAQQISLFITAVEQDSSEDNLVTSLEEVDYSLSVTFENGASHIIPSRLATYQENPLDIDIFFTDGRQTKLQALNSDFQLGFTENGSVNVPLSKLCFIDIPFRGYVQWTALGRNGKDSDIVSSNLEFEKGFKEFYVHGLYVEGVTLVEISYFNRFGFLRYTQIFDLMSDPISENLKEVDIESTIFDDTVSNRLFLSQHRSSNYPFIIDQFGDIRWTINEMVGGWGLQQTNDGDIIAARELQIIKTSLSGKVDRFEIPAEYGSIHHDIIAMPNPDQYLLTVDSPDGLTVEDYLILFDAESLAVIKEWDLKKSVPRMPLLIDDEEDWFHVNAISFDKRDQTILISGQRSAVVKISWNNELVWILTDPARLEGVNTGTIDIEGGKSINEVFLTDFDGDIITWGQHDIRINPTNDTYYLFDNGLGRYYSNQITFSRGVNFSIDIDNNRFNILETFGENRPEFYSPIISSIDFNASGSVLVNFGSIGYQFNYISNINWHTPVWKIEYPGYGAAWIEYDQFGAVITEILFSNPDENNRDPGIYRARYASLSS